MSTDAAPLPSPDSLRDALREVIDPEAGMNIVDLGLVYDVAVRADGVRVVMTTTSPACPVGELIADEVEAALRAAVPADMPVDVTLTWSPAWDSSMMSDAARRHFGW
ncbi:MAG: metal-sulfur cluster assembly factor [Gammaproteobacteria bacterium]|jgi:metal-sulfur cluster biosynthetic enzyme|nr:metal-sulfur cluster assembly factor [Gammaproteobacteria bacterium]